MPVGRVFNAAQNQVLISPVSNYYEGKAIRLGLQNRALANQGLEQEVDMADAKFDLESRRVAAYEQQATTQEEGLKLRRKQFEQEVGKERAKEYAVEGFGITYAIDTAVTNKEVTQDEALSMAAEEFARYAETLPEERKADLFEVLQNGLTIDEYRSVKAGFIGALGEYGLLDTNDKDGGYTLNQGGQRYDKNNRMVAYNPQAEKPADFEPPNKQELEAATALVEDDPVLDDLPSKQRRVAAQILASEIRQLQAAGKSYEEAAAIAIAGLKKKVTLEPDFLTGTDSKLNLGGQGLADNEFLGTDGNIYTEGRDGSFSRKN